MSVLKQHTSAQCNNKRREEAERRREEKIRHEKRGKKLLRTTDI
jgi:hypothetical protein